MCFRPGRFDTLEWFTQGNETLGWAASIHWNDLPLASQMPTNSQLSYLMIDKHVLPSSPSSQWCWRQSHPPSGLSELIADSSSLECPIPLEMHHHPITRAVLLWTWAHLAIDWLEMEPPSSQGPFKAQCIDVLIPLPTPFWHVSFNRTTFYHPQYLTYIRVLPKRPHSVSSALGVWLDVLPKLSAHKMKKCEEQVGQERKSSIFSLQVSYE